MSEFKLRNRPKKPSVSTSVQHYIGNYVSVEYLLECIEEFKTKYSERDLTMMRLEADCNYEEKEVYVYLLLPPHSYKEYERKLLDYKVAIKEYQEWQKKYKKQIEKAKVEKRKKIAKNKLERTKIRLAKEMEEVKSKLERHKE